jgi:hypothetical protein
VHRGTFVVHYRAERVSHGLSKVGIPGAAIGLQPEDQALAKMSESFNSGH